MSGKPETVGAMIRVPLDTFDQFPEINLAQGEGDAEALLKLIEAYVENHKEKHNNG